MDMHIQTNLQDRATAQPALLPVQQRAYERLVEQLQFQAQVAFVGTRGSGRSTIIRRLAQEHGGKVVDAEAFAALNFSYRNRHQTGAFRLMERLLRRALQEHDLVIVDDHQALQHGGSYALRPGILEPIRREARAANKRLVVVHDAPRPGMFESEEDAWRWFKRVTRDSGRTALVAMEDFGARDYEQLIRGALGERVADVDFDVLYRYASKLRCHELLLACRLLITETSVATDGFIHCLEQYVLHSNLRVNEVEALSFETLPGSEGIIEGLETHVILPFENRSLAQKLGVKPKRGVLLYGPPGTGKTSIGRALAHRMQGKFFMIDGSVNTEPPTAFFDQFQRIVALAKENSPSVLFIDDADVLFGIHHVSGLVRYLLSLLDGLESESAGNVCVMMTAMDPRRVPDALIRSGRVELWLETRPPSAEIRSRILQRWNRPGLPNPESIDYARVGAMTEGFTPADLRRIAADARLLYAADLAGARDAASATDYMVNAAQDIIDVRTRMARTLATAAPSVLV